MHTNVHDMISGRPDKKQIRSLTVLVDQIQWELTLNLKVLRIKYRCSNSMTASPLGPQTLNSSYKVIAPVSDFSIFASIDVFFGIFFAKLESTTLI